MLINRWWSFLARLDAIRCILRRHNVEWRANASDLPGECDGDIVCHTCDLIHWCRWYDRKANLR